MKLEWESVTVPVAGKERDAMNVSRKTLYHAHVLLTVFSAAICEPMCENGGSCKALGYCQCTPGWRGQLCEERESF